MNPVYILAKRFFKAWNAVNGYGWGNGESMVGIDIRNCLATCFVTLSDPWDQSKEPRSENLECEDSVQ